MNDWIAALIARGLLNETQGIQLRAIHESGAHRKPSFVAEPPAEASPEAARVLACSKCSCVFTGEGGSANCPRCGGPLRAFELGGPLVSSGRPDAKPRGKQFGRYVLERTLGKGGMGIVYEAWDGRLQRRVALKMLAGAADELDRESVERFQREARSAAKLKHPAIVGILDVGREAGRHFLTMDYVKGLSMHDRLYAVDADDSFPMADRITVLTRVASALAAAHQAGIVHRDLKPSNIIIDGAGLGYLTDFGLARDLHARHHERLTVSGSVLGTFEFMSPEQVDPTVGAIGPASDVFSFGVVLYLALTGELPAEKDALPSLQAVAGKPLPRPSSKRPGVPPHLDRLVASCLKRNPADRPKDGAALSAALAIRPAGSIRRRRAMAVAGVLASVALVGFAAGWGAGRGGRSKAAPRGAPAVAQPPADPVDDKQIPPGENSSPSEPPKSAAALKNARDLLARAPKDASNPRREPISAESLARQILASDPRNAEASFVLAEARMRLGRMDDGAEILRALAREAPDPGPVGLALAWDSLLRLRTEGLSPCVEKISPPVPASLAPIFENAVTAAWADDLDRAGARAAAALLADREFDARSACEEAVAIGKSSPRRWRVLWLQATLSGVSKPADIMDLVARNFVPDPLALCALGALLVRIGRSEEAVAAWTQAIESDERCAPAHHGLASNRRREGTHSETLTLLARTLAADPDWAPALLDRAVLLMETKPPAAAAAITDLDRLCSLRPDFAPARFHRARARAARGDYGSAADGYREALDRDATRVEAWFGSADCLRRLGRRTEAIEDVRKGLALSPDSENGQVLLVGLLADTGVAKDALSAAAQAIARFPRNPRLRIARIPILINEGRYDEALEDADVAVEGLPEDPTPRKLRLHLRYRKNNWKGQLEDALWVRGREPDDLDAIFWCGASREELGEFDKARADLNELRQKAPEDSYYWKQAGYHLLSIEQKEKRRK